MNNHLGANPAGKGRTAFRVWAPRARTVHLKLTGPRAALIPMEREEDGYFSVTAEAGHGAHYFYRLDDEKDRPDPVSRFLPEGVHGPTAVFDPDHYRWRDASWKGLPIEDYILYEVHTGTFTPDGTFDAVQSKLEHLKKLGVTCVEIMPVAQFPGRRNWGYDGVSLYAVQASYGGPDRLKALVDACHAAGLAVCLDVVYNHLGPEGNYLRDFGPYFTGRYSTPWGEALNYDDAECHHVRRFIVGNALYWVREYHADALRLDAVHCIYDFGARHILEELNDEVRALAARMGRRVHVIAESDLNDHRLVYDKKKGGYGLGAQWSDDFHHAVHAKLTGERQGYYEDFGSLGDVAAALRDSFVYAGQYSKFRRRPHGNSTRGLGGEKFVHCIQNHDQVGNRAVGDRLAEKMPADEQKLAAGLLLLSPYVPLLWMGQEYGEKAPFRYFIDHQDPALVEAVRQGRLKEFESFGWKEVPDPQSPQTFQDSKLVWDRLRQPAHRDLFLFYRELIALRREIGFPGKTPRGKVRVRFDENSQWIALECRSSKRWVVFFAFPGGRREIRFPGARTQRLRERLNSGGFTLRRPGRASELTIERPGCAVWEVRS